MKYSRFLLASVSAFSFLTLAACQGETSPVSNASSIDSIEQKSEFDDVVTTSGNDGRKGIQELEMFEFLGSYSDGAVVAALEKGDRLGSLGELQMQQVAIARRAVIHFGGVYGEAIAAGEYLNDPDSSWSYNEMTDADTETPIDVVHFSERDDGSYSVMFAQGSTEILYVFYEN